MKELISKVEKWFADRQIIENSTPLKQALKTSEEVLELQNAIVDNDLDEIKDAIGDIQVTLIGVCLHYGYDFNNFLSGDYNELRRPTALEDSYDLEDCVINLKQVVSTGAYTDHYLNLLMSTLSKITNRYNLTLEECLQSAYKEISFRKGVMVNGQFVKD